MSEHDSESQPTPAHPAFSGTSGHLPDRKVLAKAAVVLVVFLGLMTVVYCSPLREALRNVRDTALQIQGIGGWAPAVFVLGVAALVTAGVPRLLFCPIAGLAFGFWQGLFLSQFATLLGYYAMFLFIRWGGRGLVERLHPRLHEFARQVGRQGIAAVFLARQLPMHGLVVNWVISITPVRHRDFLVGSAIGLIPEAIPCTLVGVGLLHGSWWTAARYAVAAAILLALAWIGLAMLRRKLLRGAPAGAASEAVRGATAT